MALIILSAMFAPSAFEINNIHRKRLYGSIFLYAAVKWDVGGGDGGALGGREYNTNTSQTRNLNPTNSNHHRGTI